MAAYDYEDTGYDPRGPSAAGASEADYNPNFVSDSVKIFVAHLYCHIREKNVYEIHQMYEGNFQRLSERMFCDYPWPSVEAVAPYVGNDHVFCLVNNFFLHATDRVLLMLGKAQFELQKLVDNYRVHIIQTITTPSESVLKELQTVEEFCGESLHLLMCIYRSVYSEHSPSHPTVQQIMLELLGGSGGSGEVAAGMGHGVSMCLLVHLGRGMLGSSGARPPTLLGCGVTVVFISVSG